MGTREQIVEAITKGKAAGETGQEPTACPYAVGSILMRAWIKGYAPARRARESSAAE
ncbi:hypothetical protein SEA_DAROLANDSTONE_5 [Streptomyces phage Darolandstone]|uniref:Uncharacterized protein n=1 Tax=Streptomyces phage Darolandstone TaxID=2315716 RepID=A0A386KPL3_9CAUD|nr:hypothetical protein HOU27_gp05 [Streptomyces phage Darolandstone]AYD86197.1 hypothetical protein SEA_DAROLANDSTONE_5 [Streptomyces phage Darolandstone]